MCVSRSTPSISPRKPSPGGSRKYFDSKAVRVVVWRWNFDRKKFVQSQLIFVVVPWCTGGAGAHAPPQSEDWEQSRQQPVHEQEREKEAYVVNRQRAYRRERKRNRCICKVIYGISLVSFRCACAINGPRGLPSRLSEHRSIASTPAPRRQ